MKVHRKAHRKCKEDVQKNGYADFLGNPLSAFPTKFPRKIALPGFRIRATSNTFDLVRHKSPRKHSSGASFSEGTKDKPPTFQLFPLENEYEKCMFEC